MGLRMGITIWKNSAFLRRTFILLSILALSMVLICVLFQFIAINTPERVDEELLKWQRLVCSSTFKVSHKNGANSEKRYLITWYNMNPYIRWRPKAWSRGFQPCKHNNCDLSLCMQSTVESDAVIFNGRRVPAKYKLKRPQGQVWIFAEDETPFTYDFDGGHWRKEFWRHAFNWSMTYDKLSTDILLEYGEIRKKEFPDRRDFLQIAKNKTRGALIITSNCETDSKRLEYISELKKYVDVDVLGKCGRKWDCGKRWIHDECFKILNTTYRFYLAFENALCRGYRTEKFFENFNYDIVLVTRGGISAEDVIKPKDVYISASEFPNAESLGKYLSQLSNNVEEYANLLEKKSQYYAPGFEEVYQKALCSICEKMNNFEVNHREIRDIETDVKNTNPCVEPKDIPRKREPRVM